MKTPCDEGVIRSGQSGKPCAPKSGPWILAATILASSMAFIDSTIVNVATPTLQSSFHTNVIDVQWVIESYGLFLAALILVGGALGDRLGRRLVFLSGVVIFAAASAACGLAPTIQLLVIARAVQGIGAALLVPGSLAIISAAFDEDSRGQAIGTWSGFTAITMAIGPVLGGWVIEHASWRWAFFINLPLAVAVVVLSLRYVPESRSSQTGPLDWIGACLATASLGAVVTGLLESSTLGWRHPAVIGSLLGGTILSLIFLWVEARAPAPMISLSLLKAGSFLGANLVTFFLYSAIGVFFYLFPMTQMQVHGYSATGAGAATLPVILLMFLLSRWSGNLVARYGGKLPLIVGPLLIAAGFISLAMFIHSGRYWTALFVPILVLGFGMALTVAPLTTVVMSSVTKNDSGAASGINNAVARVAGVLAIAVFGIVMVKTFAGGLDRELPRLHLKPETVQEIQSHRTELAGMELPRDLDSEDKAAVHDAVSNAFLSVSRLVLLSCGVLSIGSSFVALAFIPKKVT